MLRWVESRVAPEVRLTGDTPGYIVATRHAILRKAIEEVIGCIIVVDTNGCAFKIERDFPKEFLRPISED